MGIVSPLGIGLEDNWAAICQGRSGIGPITKFDTTEYPCKIAGEVKNFDPSAYIDKKDQKKMDIFIQFALAAGTMAIKQSGLVIDESTADRVGVLVGSGLGGLSDNRKVSHDAPGERPEKSITILCSHADSKPCSRPDLDLLWMPRAQQQRGHGLRYGQSLYWRGIPHHPARGRRCHDSRRR